MGELGKKVSLIVKIVMSLTFFMVLISFVNGNKLLNIFDRVNYKFLALSFLVSFVMVVASCWKWKIILDLKRKLPFMQLFRIYFIGYFFSNILPSTVGGDVVRSYYSGNLIENQAYAAVAVFVERFSGVFFLFFLAGVAPFFYPPVLQSPSVYLPALLGLLFALITIFLVTAKNPFTIPNLIVSWIFKLLRAVSDKLNISFLGKAVDWIEKIYQNISLKLRKVRDELKIASQAIKTDKSFLYKLIFLTIFFYFLTWVNVYTSFRAFGVDISFWKVCALVPAIMFVAHIPVTLLGNLGYVESVFVFYFLLIGVDGAESLAMGLLLRIKMLTMGVIGLLTYAVYKQRHRPFKAGK